MSKVSNIPVNKKGLSHFDVKFEVEEGIVRSDSLARYKIPRINHVPRIVSMLVEHPAAEGPFGAKGVGEITSIPTAPAVANAVHHAIGLRSFSLPVGVPRGKETS